MQTKQTVFTRFVSFAVSVNIRHVVLALMMPGIMIALAGILVECNHQNELAMMGGNTLDAYRSLMQAQAIDSIVTYISAGVQLRLPSAGGNLQAIGVAVCYILTPWVCAVLFALRLSGFNRKNESWEEITA